MRCRGDALARRLLLLATLVTPRPHDALFRSAFEAPDAAAAFLRSLVSADIRDSIAWESLRGESGSYVDPALADSYSDLLFSALLRTGEVLQLYLLLEHQSTEDPTMPLRAAAYQIRIWERFLKEHKAAPLPPIVSVVIRHVPGGWTKARSLEDMFEPRVVGDPALSQLIPRFSLIIEDLAHLSDDDLKARSLAAFQKLALWLLRDARDPARLLASFDAWASTMLQLLQAPSGMHAFAILAIYMFPVIGPMNRSDLHAKIHRMSAAAEKVAMSIADEIHEEGRQEGLQAGRVDALCTLLKLKLGLSSLDAQHEARLRAASPEAIDRYLQRVLVADSMAAVFDD